ncbi:MAG: hypothetical protein FWG32_09500 [Oscillospiraceae bacterium]|nr:hypothetical protein [Oscillospiraceae bacterium]
MSRIKAVLGKTTFNTPIFAASGCFGHAYEMAEFTDIPKIGAISPKSVTKEPRKGNPPPRLWHGIGVQMSSVGLQNPGIDVYVKEKVPLIKSVCRPDQILVSVAGGCIEDYVYNVDRIINAFGEDGFAAVEINAVCPNVSVGGSSFSKVPANLAELVKAVRPLVKKNALIIKIITLFDTVLDAAKAVEDNGADIIFAANHTMGMVIDVEKQRPYLHAGRGGLEGAAMLPIGVMKVWDIYNTVKIPIISSGGIRDLDGALQYFMAGASAVALGSVIFADPMLPATLPLELDSWLAGKGIAHYSEIVGAAHK